MVRRAFTLVELMIVVAIVAILAAIAVPAMYDAQLKAKLSEGKVNARGLGDYVRMMVDVAEVTLPTGNVWHPRILGTLPAGDGKQPSPGIRHRRPGPTSAGVPMAMCVAATCSPRTTQLPRNGASSWIAMSTAIWTR